jgi:hypothetical protein
VVDNFKLSNHQFGDEKMLGQAALIRFRLQSNDLRWKKIKRVYDRFETISLEDWEFLTEWLKDREKLRKQLFKNYGGFYKDPQIDD